MHRLPCSGARPLCRYNTRRYRRSRDPYSWTACHRESGSSQIYQLFSLGRSRTKLKPRLQSRICMPIDILSLEYREDIELFFIQSFLLEHDKLVV